MDSPLIRYSLQIADLERHHFVVHCRLGASAAGQRLSLPSWIPGSYLLREFARQVVSIDATSNGSPVAIAKVAKGSWACPEAHDDLSVRITVYALDQSVRGAYLDRRRGFFNGTCVFLLPEGRENEPVELEIAKPEWPACEDWQVATAMPASKVDASGFGSYRADSYDELIDHPVEISRFESVEFEAAGVPHRLVVAGRFEADLDRVATDLAQLCTAQIDFFGRPAPFPNYTFLGLAVGDGYGGLEHRASSSLIFRRDDLPKFGETGVPRNYQRFLGLASHEYFHSWHIKRSKPAAFVPYALDRRNHTQLLWVFEGITTYYQELFLVRAGLIGLDAYLRRLGELMTRVYRGPGRFQQTLAESSFDAWDSLYKPEPNSPNVAVSYYSKGALAALALDLTLRSKEKGDGKDNGATLDDIVVELWRRFGQAGIGVPEDGFEALAIELGGADLAPFFDRAIRGTDDLPLADLLSAFGLKLKFRQAGPASDLGGTPASDATERLGLAASFRGQPAGLELVTVFDRGPAEAAGLNSGDCLIALDGLKLTEQNLVERLARYEGGDRIPVSYFRGDELLESTLELAPKREDSCYIEIDPEPSPEALARRKRWLAE